MRTLANGDEVWVGPATWLSTSPPVQYDVSFGPMPTWGFNGHEHTTIDSYFKCRPCMATAQQP